MLKLSERFAILFACYALVATTSIALLMPPLQAADETNHVAKADSIGRGLLIDSRNREGSSAGAMVSEGLVRLDTAFAPLRFHPDRKVDTTMRAASVETSTGRPVWMDFPNTAIYPPFFYASSSIGLRAGRWLTLTEWHSVLLARLLTAFASTVLAVVAITRAGGFAPLLFTLLCLPMTLGLFAAVSQDGLMIASAALAVVLLTHEKRRDFIMACLLLAAIASARPPYLPLCLLPLLVPSRRWIERGAGAGLCAGAVAGWTVLTARLTLPPETPVHIAAQLAAIREHPARLLHVAVNTLQLELVNGLPVGREFVGVLGWLDTTLPNAFYAMAGAVLLLSAFVSDGYRPTRTVLRPIAASLLIVVAIGMVYAIQYLDWSGIGALQVDGVQGRYFLALVPAMLFVLPKREPPSRAILLTIATFPALSIAVTIRAIVIRYGLV